MKPYRAAIMAVNCFLEPFQTWYYHPSYVISSQVTLFEERKNLMYNICLIDKKAQVSKTLLETAFHKVSLLKILLMKQLLNHAICKGSLGILWLLVQWLDPLKQKVN